MTVAGSVASRYFERGIEQEDLLQVAYAALTRAARDFEPTGTRTSSPTPCRRSAARSRSTSATAAGSVRPPRRIQEMQGRIQRAQGALAQRLAVARPQRMAGGATRTWVSVGGHVRGARSDPFLAGQTRDQGEDGHDASVCELLGESDASQPAVEARATLAPVVRQLKERDRRILYRRFFEERTRQEIADEIGVTQMQV